MATKDGKTFGKFELEVLYDYMMEHKDYGFKTFVNYAVKTLDMAQDDAVEAVVAMRKERRKAIMQQPIVYFTQNLVEKASGVIMRDKLVQIIMEGWNVDQPSAEDLVDEAIANIPDPCQRLIMYDSFETMTRGLEKVVGRLPPASNEERVCDPSLDMKKMAAYASGEAKMGDTIAPSSEDYAKLMADWAQRQMRLEAFEGVFLDRLDIAEKVLLDIITEGERFRDQGGVNPYRGNTLAHCLHAFGWVQRDLALALEKATGGTYKARVPRWTTAMDASTRPEHYRSPGAHAGVSASVDLEDFDVGTLTSKYKGYRFPGEVVSRFTTRKGKVRYVVEGIADGNDECLHIFSASDLQTLTVEHGWVYSGDGYWWWSHDYPTERHDSGSIRPATAAEHQFIRAIAEGTPQPFGSCKG